MRHSLVAVLLVLLASGCAQQLQPFHARPDIDKGYQLNQAMTAGIGEPLFNVRYVYEYPAYTPAFAYDPPDVDGTVTPALEPGQEWVATWRAEDGSYVLEQPPSYVRQDNLTLAVFVDPQGVLVDDAGWFNLSTHESLPSALFSPPDRALFTSTGWTPVDIFFFDMVYEGLENGVVTISYREFALPYFRPRHTELLTCDLGQCNHVLKRSILVEIIEATKDTLTFTVTHDNTYP